MVCEKNRVVKWISFTAHSLNLVGKNAAECCSSAVIFYFLVKRYVFFTNSTHRHHILTETSKFVDASLSLRRVTTRSHSQACDSWFTRTLAGLCVYQLVCQSSDWGTVVGWYTRQSADARVNQPTQLSGCLFFECTRQPIISSCRRTRAPRSQSQFVLVHVCTNWRTFTELSRYVPFRQP